MTLSRRKLIVAVVLGALVAAARAPAQPSAADDDGRHAVSTLEQGLWCEIVASALPNAVEESYDAWFVSTERLLVRRVERVRHYLTLYPGGAHRDEAIRLELEALFGIATLRCEDPTELRRRCRELLRQPSSEAVAAEAAYWSLVCSRFECPDSADESLPAPGGLVDSEADYLRRYPRSRFVPRLAVRLYEQSEQRDDVATMSELAQLMRDNFPTHSATKYLEARQRLHDALGKPWQTTFPLVTGGTINTADLTGHPLAIVVWAGHDKPAVACVRAIEQARVQHPTLQVVGVSLADRRTTTQAAAAQLGVSWPQSNDERGWGGRFVRMWGIRQIPHLIVLDRAGKLLGHAGPADWPELLERAVNAAGEL